LTEEILFYKSKAERLTIIDSIQLEGKNILHDDFLDSEGKATDGNSGKLTFDFDIIKPPTTDEIRIRELTQKLSDDTITDLEVKEFLRLRFVNDLDA